MPGRLRSKLPELVVEGFSVMLAVLLALAADSWREDRANRELAVRARASVLEEVRGNLAELNDTREDHVALLERLVRDIDELDAGGTSAEVGFSFALLSSAAWQTAQVTRATQFLDFEWVRRMAQLYDAQELFEDNQAAVVDLVAEIRGRDPGEVARRLEAVAARAQIVLNLQEGLMDAYRAALEDAPASD